MVWACPANASLVCPPVLVTNYLTQLARDEVDTNPGFWTRGLVPRLSVPGWLAQEDRDLGEVQVPISFGQDLERLNLDPNDMITVGSDGSLGPERWHLAGLSRAGAGWGRPGQARQTRTGRGRPGQVRAEQAK